MSMTAKDVAFVDSIPLEVSQEEYNDLISQVQGLTIDETKEELLDCARYGEVDAVRAILHVRASDKSNNNLINCVDDGGNTALHKSCANGHFSTTNLLLNHGARHLPNQSGNSPLHWASAAGHDKIVELLLEHISDIDVLQKNEFGRSALTEGFSSKNTLLVKLLLEHDSATEERLLSGGKEVTDDEQGDRAAETGEDTPDESSSSKKKRVVVHEFDFRIQPGEIVADFDRQEPIQQEENPPSTDSSPTKRRQKLLIRELPIAHADNPFGDSAIEDTTGYGIWCASIAMARWMASPEMSKRFSGKSVLELGAGCGVPGLAAALYSNANKVYVTDLNPTTVRNLQHNIDLNVDEFQQDSGNVSRQVVACPIDWDDETTFPTEKIDYVIGSDLIYQSNIVPLLKKVVLGLLKPHGKFLYVAPDTGRDGLPEFIDSMNSDGCRLVKQQVAPPSFHSNPLSNQDDDECFLHFHELASSTYILYEFECS